MSNEKQRGGHRAGAGRHKADCDCERCNVRRDLERVALEEEEKIKMEEKNDSKPDENKADEKKAEEKPNGENPNPNPDDKPSDDKTGNQNPNPNPNADGKSKINFDRYRTVKSKDETKTGDKKPRQGKGAAPVQEPVVVISGTVLLAIINFITPHLFGYIAKFLKQDFVSDDFRLDKSAYKDLTPAADEVAKKWFRNMSPELQLMIGYTAISWTSAQLKRSLRKKDKEEKK